MFQRLRSPLILLSLHCILIIIIINITSGNVDGFVIPAPSVVHHENHRRHHSVTTSINNSNNHNKQKRVGRFMTMEPQNTNGTATMIAGSASLDDLEPPEINFVRNSILFDENPQTKRNNIILNVWKSTRRNVPKFITGAWYDDRTLDDNPMGALYNMAFVRLPILLAYTGYLKNTFLDNHPIFIDFGNGPFLFHPIAATALLILMLGPCFIVKNKNNNDDQPQT